MIVSRSVYMVRHPRGSYIVHPLLSLYVATPENRSIHWTLSSICKNIRLTSGSHSDTAHPPCDSPNSSRPFALGASNVCLVGENPTCSVPALYGRDARVYGHPITATHGMNTPPPFGTCLWFCRRFSSIGGNFSSRAFGVQDVPATDCSTVTPSVVSRSLSQ